MGVSYNNGQGLRQDHHKAAELYKKACNGGNIKGCYNLGVLYNNGQGLRQNYYTAKEYFGKACDLGDQKGCDAYKKLNERGF